MNIQVAFFGCEKGTPEKTVCATGFDSRYFLFFENKDGGHEMHASITSPDPTILRYVMGVCKADEVRGELIGQAIVIARELNAWMDCIERKEVEG